MNDDSTDDVAGSKIMMISLLLLTTTTTFYDDDDNDERNNGDDDDYELACPVHGDGRRTAIQRKPGQLWQRTGANATSFHHVFDFDKIRFTNDQCI